MANPEHVEIVKQGAEAIAAWRERNPSDRLDLPRAKRLGVGLFTADLAKAILHICREPIYVPPNPRRRRFRT